MKNNGVLVTSCSAILGQKAANVCSRGAESWWGCSDSDSDSDTGLLIDSDFGSDSDSDSGPDTKYKMNNIFIVEGVSAAQAKKET